MYHINPFPLILNHGLGWIYAYVGIWDHTMVVFHTGDGIKGSYSQQNPQQNPPSKILHISTSKACFSVHPLPDLK